MNTIKTFFVSGFANWKTTAIGAIIAVLTAWQTGVFDGKTGTELWIAIGIFVWGFVSRDANKSSQDSGVRKPTFAEELLEASRGKNRNGIIRFWWIVPFLCLSSCATRSDGTKTFADMDLSQWGKVGGEAFKGAVVRGLPEFYNQRDMSHAKEATEVQP
jgi:hypothetical protein